MVLSVKVLVFTLFATSASFNPFYSLFMLDKGFDAMDLGTLMSFSKGMMLVSTPIVCSIAERYNNHQALMGLLSIIAAVMMLILYASPHDSYTFAALILGIYSCCTGAKMAICDTLVLAACRAEKVRYALQRLWGSVSYGTVAICMGMGLRYLNEIAEASHSKLSGRSTTANNNAHVSQNSFTPAQDMDFNEAGAMITMAPGTDSNSVRYEVVPLVHSASLIALAIVLLCLFKLPSKKTSDPSSSSSLATSGGADTTSKEKSHHSNMNTNSSVTNNGGGGNSPINTMQVECCGDANESMQLLGGGSGGSGGSFRREGSQEKGGGDIVVDHDGMSIDTSTTTATTPKNNKASIVVVSTASSSSRPTPTTGNDGSSTSFLGMLQRGKRRKESAKPSAMMSSAAATASSSNSAAVSSSTANNNIGAGGGVGSASAATTSGSGGGAVNSSAGGSSGASPSKLQSAAAAVNSNRKQIMSTFEGYRRLLATPDIFFPLLGGTTLVAIAECGINYFLFPYLRRELKAPPILFSYILAIHSVSEVICFAFGSEILVRLGPTTMMVTSCLAFGFKAYSYSVITSAWSVLPIEAAHGMCFAFMWTAIVAHMEATSSRIFEAQKRQEHNAQQQLTHQQHLIHVSSGTIVVTSIGDSNASPTTIASNNNNSTMGREPPTPFGSNTTPAASSSSGTNNINCSAADDNNGGDGHAPRHLTEEEEKMSNTTMAMTTLWFFFGGAPPIVAGVLSGAIVQRNDEIFLFKMISCLCPCVALLIIIYNKFGLIHGGGGQHT